MFNTLLIQPLANGLIVFYRLLGNNLGLAIIGFSLLLRFLLRPLTKPYMDSMKKMRDLAPQLEKVKKKHAKDPVKLAQAQSDFYKQQGINPGAGCLPYILQIVILIAFFRVFTLTLANGGELADNFNELLYEQLKFPVGEIVNTRLLYLDMTKPDVFSYSGVPFPIPGPLLLLAAMVQLVSAKIMQPYVEREEEVAKKTPDKTDDMQVAVQQSMIYMFPLMTILIGIRFPSGLALYWLVFSLTQAVQQYNSQGWGNMTPILKRLGLVKQKNL